MLAGRGPGLVSGWDFPGQEPAHLRQRPLSGTPDNSRPVRPGDEVEAEGLGRLVNHIVEGSAGVRGDVGAQPTESEEVRSTALDGDWEFRGIRPPRRSQYCSGI